MPLEIPDDRCSRRRRQKRWLMEFRFWLGIHDGFGNLAHRYYVEKALAAGFHIASVDVGPSCGSPAAADICQEFYELLVSNYGLHRRARALAPIHAVTTGRNCTSHQRC
jgi:hypothetical protein